MRKVGRAPLHRLLQSLQGRTAGFGSLSRCSSDAVCRKEEDRCIVRKPEFPACPGLNEFLPCYFTWSVLKSFIFDRGRPKYIRPLHMLSVNVKSTTGYLASLVFIIFSPAGSCLELNLSAGDPASSQLHPGQPARKCETLS